MKRLILVACAGASLAGIAWKLDADKERSRLMNAHCTWGSDIDLTELRKEMRVLRADVDRARAEPQTRLAPPEETLAAATETADHEDERLTEEGVEQPEPPGPDEAAAEYQRHLAAVAERYARLDTQFRAQTRDPRWAHEHEEQIVALPSV